MTSVLESGFRDDLTEAHRATIAAVGRAGAWWSGPQRFAIASEVRRAFEHADAPPWQAPSSIDGMISEDHVLPAAAVDAIWRITNHPGTLTADWYAGIVAQLPTPEHYIELVSVVAPMNAVDRFAAYLNLEPMPLPDPSGDPPSNETVSNNVTSHWVPTADINGPNVRKALTGSAGATEVYSALSEAQYVAGDALLGDLDWTRGTLDRRQIELIAAKTSMMNDCFY